MHFFLTHWKANVIGLTIVGWIALISNEVTSPKVIAVMVFLFDWNMHLTPEWWLSKIFMCAVAVGAWWWQKRKNDRKFAAQQTEWASKVSILQGEVRHSELLLAAQRTQILFLTGRDTNEPSS